MRTLRKLLATVVLMMVLAVSAVAGEIPTPPCTPEPGQTDTPPCSAAPGDMSTTSTATGDIGTSTVTSDEMSFSKIAADVFLEFLPLF